MPLGCFAAQFFKTNERKTAKYFVKAKSRKRKVKKKVKFSTRMAPLRFNIPLQRKDLLRGASNGQYWVENEYSIRELKTKLVVRFFRKI